MSIQTTSTSGIGYALTNSLRTQYLENYIEAALANRLYDQISSPIGKNMSELEKGSAVQVNFLSQMAPGTTAISEVADVTPQYLLDGYATLTPTSRGEALQVSEKLLIEAYTDYGQKLYGRIGQNMMESVDLLAQTSAMAANLALRPAGVARSALTAASTGHRATDALFAKVATLLQSLHVASFTDTVSGQPAWPAIMHPGVFHDIRQDGNVNSIAIYQNQAILFNWEMGSVGPFRLVVSPWAKVFFGAGAVNGTDSAVTTTHAAVSALDKTMTSTTNTHLDNVGWVNVLDVVESGSTLYPKNERVWNLSQSGSTETFIGSGENGGLKYSHDSGIVLNNNYSAYTITFGGPQSLAKVYATEIGEFGTVVGPERVGTLDQWLSIGWKWYGGYGQMNQNSIVRYEVASSADSPNG
jgi:N4-gp56 family major capsid protein